MVGCEIHSYHDINRLIPTSTVFFEKPVAIRSGKADTKVEMVQRSTFEMLIDRRNGKAVSKSACLNY
jgi:hypothetical protein